MSLTNSRKHTGAGVLIITSINNEPYILLGREDRKSLTYKNYTISIYEEFGGAIHSKKAGLNKNALFELREETANLINIYDPKILDNAKYFDLPYLTNRMYRLYVLYLKNIADYIDYFDINLSVIKNNNILLNSEKAGTYMEMNKIELIPLYDIEKKINLLDNVLNININNKNKKILMVNEDIYLNSRLFYFLKEKYNGISGIYHLLNYYNELNINSLLNNNIKNSRNENKYNTDNKSKIINIKNIRFNAYQNNEKYLFLSGTYSIII